MLKHLFFIVDKIEHAQLSDKMIVIFRLLLSIYHSQLAVNEIKQLSRKGTMLYNFIYDL